MVLPKVRVGDLKLMGLGRITDTWHAQKTCTWATQEMPLAQARGSAYVITISNQTYSSQTIFPTSTESHMMFPLYVIAVRC